MIKITSVLCANGIIQDKVTDNITIYSVIDRINSSVFPVFIPNLNVFGLFDRESEDIEKFEYDLLIYNNENELANIKIKVDFHGKYRFRSIVRLEGFVIQSPGLLTMQFKLPDGVEESYRIGVMKIGEVKQKEPEKSDE